MCGRGTTPASTLTCRLFGRTVLLHVVVVLLTVPQINNDDDDDAVASFSHKLSLLVIMFVCVYAAFL